MACKECVNYKRCTGTVSSNGHSTWATAIFLDMEVPEGDDLGNVYAPAEGADGSMECNQWKRAPGILITKDTLIE